MAGGMERREGGKKGEWEEEKKGGRQAFTLKSLKTLVSGFCFYKMKNAVGAKLKSP